MTSATGGTHAGVLAQVVDEKESGGDGYDVQMSLVTSRIHADLSIGANISDADPLLSNSEISCPGVKLHGSGFIVTPEEASSLGLDSIAGLSNHIRPYRNGRDLAASPRDVMVIDLFGLTADEVRQKYPAVYQWVLERVKPERDQNNREGYKKNWWIHGEARGNFRPALVGLSRYIATVETSKHRFFVFLDASILPDNMLVNIAIDDAYALGVLSSRIHVCWALAQGGTLEDRPRYNKTRCFETFPLPAATPDQQQRIRDLAEQLDTHRKRQQVQHPDLTMTGMYNVLEKLRSGDVLTAKDKKIHEQGLVSVLKQLHDDLDAAVFAAYGWPANLPDDEILTRLVALNAERAREEKSGHIRWLRPDFQNKQKKPTQTEMGIKDAPAPNSKIQIPKSKIPWPPSLPDQMRLLRQTLITLPAPATPAEIAKLYTRAKVDNVEELLKTLVILGQARESGGRYG
jgi:hypothetical protein